MDDGGSFWSTLPGLLTALAGLLTAGATLVGALYSAGVLGSKRKAGGAAGAGTPDPAPAGSPSGPPAGVPPGPGARPAGPPTTAAPSLRTTPGILSGADLRALLIQRGYFDTGANPGGKGVAHDYVPKVVGSDIVLQDAPNRLVWQHGGSARAMTVADAQEYLRHLNRERFAGFSDWRLPTVEEAGTLLRRDAHGGFHIAEAFQRGVNFIWTADRHPDGRGWMVYFLDAHFDAAAPDFNAWVRAVRGPESG